MGRTFDPGDGLAGGRVAGAEVGEEGLAVGTDPPVCGTITAVDRLVVVPQAERTRMDTSKTECNRALISLLSLRLTPIMDKQRMRHCGGGLRRAAISMPGDRFALLGARIDTKNSHP